MNRITLYSLVFLLCAIAFISYRAYPDNPLIEYEGELSGIVGGDEAIAIIRQSDIYREFDRTRRIKEISIFPVSPEDNSSVIDVLSGNIGTRIENQVYVATVMSTTKCPRTSYLVFFLDSADGKILRTKAWSQC